jgi:putative flippase GtrA
MFEIKLKESFLQFNFKSLFSKELFKFLLIAGFGALLDFLVFFILATFWVSVFLANYISSSLSVIFVYYLSNRFLYSSTYSHVKFTKFVVWYILSITFFSLVISILVNFANLNSILAKISIMPASFISNFFAGKKILNG